MFQAEFLSKLYCMLEGKAPFKLRGGCHEHKFEALHVFLVVSKSSHCHDITVENDAFSYTTIYSNPA